MGTKISLTIDNITHDLNSDSLKNWGDILCTYKRADFDGVVRAFSSKFEFVNDAYDMLLALYLRDGFAAKSKVTVSALDNNWRHEKLFEADLDFTSISIDNGVLSISAVDNSVAAIIKANKSTKYEFTIGEDIKSDRTFHFDRLPIQERLTYKFTDGVSVGETAALDIYYSPGDGLHHRQIWLGNTGSEVCIGGAIYWNDDQTTDADAYILECKGDQVAMQIEADVTYDLRHRSGSGGELLFVVKNKRAEYRVIDSVPTTDLSGSSLEISAVYPNEDELNRQDPASNYHTTGDIISKYVLVGDIVYALTYKGAYYAWENTHKTEDEYFIRTAHLSLPLLLVKGDRLILEGGATAWGCRMIDSEFVFSWINRGKPCDMDAFTPQRVATTLLNKISAGNTNIQVHISNYDERINKTIILAGESLRGLPEAKLYTTFTEFCDWMSTVFGYVWYIGDRHTSPLHNIVLDFDGTQSIGYTFVDDECEVVRQIWYHEGLKRFVCYGTKAGHNNYFSRFPGSENYNDGDRPFTDRLFTYEGKYYIFDASTDTLQEYEYQPENAGLDIVDIHFVHRSELFREDANVVDFGQSRVTYSVDASLVYSAIEIGYEKKDYDEVNGRDEFNCTNSYSTGLTNTDKKLTLQSKYRADCYGLEFAAQHRDSDTTERSQDNDVYFVYCRCEDADCYPDRTDYKVVGGLTDQLFNGAYSPMMCVKANEGYISAQGAATLTFTSSTGNSDMTVQKYERVETVVEPEEGDEDAEAVVVVEYVQVEEYSVSSDISVDTPVFSVGQAEFETDMIDIPVPQNDMISVVDNGLRYYGYLRETEMKLNRQDAQKYKLIVKSIVIC